MTGETGVRQKGFCPAGRGLPMALGRRQRPARIRWFGLGIILAAATLGCSNTDKLPSKNKDLFPTPRLPAPSNLDPATKATTAPTTHSKAPQWNPRAPAPDTAGNPAALTGQPQRGQQTPLGVAPIQNNPAVMMPTPAPGSFGPSSMTQPIHSPTIPVMSGEGTNTGFLPPIGSRDPVPTPPTDGVASTVTVSSPGSVLPPTPLVISAPLMPNSTK